MTDVSRMSWVDLVGESIVAGLAESAGVDLTPAVRDLLDNFAELVERESKTRAIRSARLTRALQEVRQTNVEVRAEFDSLRRSDSRLNDSDCFKCERHAETLLPVVSLRLRDLPELVIAVPRDYGAPGRGRGGSGHATRRKLTFGFATRTLQEAYAPAPIPAKIAAALSAMAAEGRRRAWAFSVAELVNLWKQTAKKIPLEERRKSSRTVRRFLKDDAAGQPARKRRRRRTSDQRWRPVRREKQPPNGAAAAAAATAAAAVVPVDSASDPEPAAQPAPPAAATTTAGSTVDPGSSPELVESPAAGKDAATDAQPVAGETLPRQEEEAPRKSGVKRAREDTEPNEAKPRSDVAEPRFDPELVYDVDDLDI